jgi:hypothetical protein
MNASRILQALALSAIASTLSACATDLLAVAPSDAGSSGGSTEVYLTPDQLAAIQAKIFDEILADLQHE